jgi:hypothetical protein
MTLTASCAAMPNFSLYPVHNLLEKHLVEHLSIPRYPGDEVAGFVEGINGIDQHLLLFLHLEAV